VKLAPNHRLFKKVVSLWGQDIEVDRITKPMVHKYLLDEALRFEKEGKDNYSVNAELRYLRALFNYAIDDLEVLDINPTRKIKFYGIDKKLKYIPPDIDMQKVCEWCYPHQQRLITFDKHSAARMSESLRSTGDDIDLSLNLLTLWTRKKKYGDLSPRRIELPEPIRDMKRAGRLFPEWEQYPRFLEKTCKELKIKSYGWHAYRHLKASQMAAQGYSLVQISNYLGHESLIITQRYLHLLGYNSF